MNMISVVRKLSTIERDKEQILLFGEEIIGSEVTIRVKSIYNVNGWKLLMGGSTYCFETEFN
jgi:hypothetical protein